MSRKVIITETKMNENDMELLTTDEVAILAKVKRRTVYSWIEKGILDVQRSKSGLIRVPKSNLLEFLNNSKNNNKTAE